jgi:hypothetical protein
MPSTPKSALVHHIVDPVGHRFPIGKPDKVRHIHTGFFPFCLPFPSIVLEMAKQFFLLAIDRDDRIALRFELLALPIDVLKLSIAIGMSFPFDRFLGFPATKTAAGAAVLPRLTS